MNALKNRAETRKQFVDKPLKIDKRFEKSPWMEIVMD